MVDEVRSGESTLLDASAAIQVARQDLENLTKKLDTKVAATAGDFEGAAAKAFRDVGTEWARRQATINKILDEFTRQLKITDSANKDSDTVAANALGNAGSNMYASNPNLG